MAPIPMILIVEDDAGAREIAAPILEAEGYQVTQANGGNQALQLLESGAAFDLVFSDINMPGGMDGIQLARRVADLDAQIPVVLTSGHAEGSFRDFPTNARFLPKPYNRQALLGMLRQQLAR
ncbi:response regulator [uncultured Pseudoxanthomonas sp.]|uniref:response regulator n=1 Tax=uncultured Pseudoxanthomonas sp. TaxID=281701 RepID=UPI0025974B80|nr:response regulator [uncultured Pseudoxanthomonas sp.]